MRIISKFHDYYDSVQRYDEDRELVYVRDKQEKQYKGVFPKSLWDYSGSHHYIYQYIIGFCGKIYSPIAISYGRLGDLKIKFCYNLDEVANFAETHFDEKQLALFMKRDRKKNVCRYGYHMTLDDLSTYFDDMSQALPEYNKMFYDYECPIFLIKSDRHHIREFVKNPCLSDCEFFRIFGSYSAYQEISMFLGNELANTNAKQIPAISDEIMAGVKGFDKYSFRKDKQV